MATTFARELGLSPAWSMVEGSDEDLMRSEALEAVLGQKDSGVMAELVRIMAKGEIRRGVHSHLLDQVEHLLQVQREVAPDVEDAWTLHFPSLEEGGSRPTRSSSGGAKRLPTHSKLPGSPGP